MIKFFELASYNLHMLESGSGFKKIRVILLVNIVTIFGNI